MKTFITMLGLIFLLAGCGQSQDSLINYSLDLEGLLLSIPGDRIHIRVNKSSYILSIMADTLVIIEK